MSLPDIAVVHLVRAQNGPEPLQRFLESYAEHPAGAPHDLIAVLKGFEGCAERRRIDELLAGVVRRVVEVPDTGFDIGAYLRAARQLDYDSYFFVNSFSCVLAPGWLDAMATHLAYPHVGVVGATGSWASAHTAWLSGFRVVPTVYSRLRREGPRQSDDSLVKGIRTILLHTFDLRYPRHFNRFPAHHVRTNAFLVRASVLRRLTAWPLETKYDVYRFESGRHSLTQQVLDLGLEPLVVGRDRVAYAKEDWWRSATFWQREQENLLVSDNQTEDYRLGTMAHRHELATLAWGDYAQPSPPRT